jgi:DNA-binding LacI/PurR family transcriptional regulator
MVGFDTIPFSFYFDPPLTTVDIPKYPIGAAAMEMPVNLISKKYAESFRWFDARLLIRDSTVERRMLKTREDP